MNLNDLIEALDQRYGNPHAKECALIQEAIDKYQINDVRAADAGNTEGSG